MISIFRALEINYPVWMTYKTKLKKQLIDKATFKTNTLGTMTVRFKCIFFVFTEHCVCDKK